MTGAAISKSCTAAVFRDFRTIRLPSDARTQQLLLGFRHVGLSDYTSDPPYLFQRKPRSSNTMAGFSVERIVFLSLVLDLFGASYARLLCARP